MTKTSRPSKKPRDVQGLSAPERELLRLLVDDGPTTIESAAAALGQEAPRVRSAASWLESKGFIETTQDERRFLGLSEEGADYAKNGTPERRLWDHLRKAGPSTLGAAEKGAALSQQEMRVALAAWQRKKLGTISRDGATTTIEAAVSAPPAEDEAALARLAEREWTPEADVAGPGLDALGRRKGLLRDRDVKSVSVRIKPGVVIPADALSKGAGTLDEITPEVLKSGSWKGRRVRPFDVGTPAPRRPAAKPHPLTQLISQVRQAFVELGFSEIDYELIQSTFWNMDALFIPQDHPARDMQDTFYLKRPERLPVPAERMKVTAAVHENGGDTGSRGWRTRYDAAEARRALLRTHTTVGTIRYLAAHPKQPCRVFSIGRVFRKETMDATHLPEFHQVEGIATEPGADFRMLIGILKEFYRRLGFEKLRWRPAYFPYTEPSMEIEVQYHGKWMELGGSGVFRPEVTEPLGVKDPVLAWGLGLERLAMLRLGRTDIRDLYVSDLEWLRTQPLL